MSATSAPPGVVLPNAGWREIVVSCWCRAGDANQLQTRSQRRPTRRPLRHQLGLDNPSSSNTPIGARWRAGDLGARSRAAIRADELSGRIPPGTRAGPDGHGHRRRVAIPIGVLSARDRITWADYVAPQRGDRPCSRFLASGWHSGVTLRRCGGSGHHPCAYAPVRRSAEDLGT